MPSVTRDSLVARVRDRGEYLAPYFTDAMLQDRVSVSRQKLHAAICAIEPSFGITSTTVAVSAGTAAYALPSDFLALTSLAAPDSHSPSGYTRLTNLPTQNADEPYLYSKAISDPRDYMYAIEGGNVVIYPTPTTSVTLAMKYQAEGAAVTDNTPFSVPAFGDEWIVSDTCEWCAVRNNEEPQVHQAAKDEAWSYVVENIRSRDRSQPTIIGEYMGPHQRYRWGTVR